MNIERKGDTVVITANVSELARKSASPSSTGKTLIVDSTHGNTKVGDLTIACNVYMANPTYQAAPKAKNAA